LEIFSAKNPFHFIGIAGNQDYNSVTMFETRPQLNSLKFPNQILIFEGGEEWPPETELNRALKYLTLAAMAKGMLAKDESYITEGFNDDLLKVNTLIAEQKMLRANGFLREMIATYRLLKNVDSLKEKRKELRKDKIFRTQKRNESNILFKEKLIREDYFFYLTEDIETYNFNNLGWWTYQMEELQKFVKSENKQERYMGKRLFGYVNALVKENIELIESEKLVDEEALSFLWMLKTITDPEDATYYLKMISFGAKYEDFGTTLFYLEELLKQGYTDQDKLYSLEHTSLIRITPEYNSIIAKYLKEARYSTVKE